MFLSIILIFCPLDGPPRKHIPKLAIVIPEDFKYGHGGWRRMPWRATKWFRDGLLFCDDPDCPQCAGAVYGYDPEADERPDVKIEKP